MLEISVRVSNEEQSYTKKYLEYSEDLVMNHDDPRLAAFVQQAIGEFKGTVDDVTVRVKMVW